MFEIYYSRLKQKRTGHPSLAPMSYEVRVDETTQCRAVESEYCPETVWIFHRSAAVAIPKASHDLVSDNFRMLLTWFTEHPQKTECSDLLLEFDKASEYLRRFRTFNRDTASKYLTRLTKLLNSHKTVKDCEPPELV